MKLALALCALALAACHSSSSPGTPDAGPGVEQVSRALALSADGGSLWTTNPESDSISQIDLASRTLTRELLLAPARPAVDASGRYDPAVRPRSIVLVESLGKAYIAAQSANAVYVVDLKSFAVTARIAVGAEPVSVVASTDGKRVYVVNHQSATVQSIDTSKDTVIGTLSIGEHPWGASLRADGAILYVTHLLLNPGVTAIDTATLQQVSFFGFGDMPPDVSRNKVIPNGQVRGAYAVVPRPKTGELWVPHLLLATGTPQPELVFNATVFPTLSLLPGTADALTRRLLFRPATTPTYPGHFTDSVSGPRDIAFTPDGSLALVAMAQSEDVMAFNADTGFEVALVRPTPTALIEGIVIDAAGTHAYLLGRSTHNLAVLTITKGVSGSSIAVDGAAIELLSTDPMPADLRRGMRLFYSANSSQAPITQDFWVACSTCHLEGQSDAVTWKFLQGPRDTPSNAGGPINTGFLFRQAVRNDVIDYDETIRIEQGGNYHRTNASQLPDLQAMAKFTNYAIPFPQNPNRSAGGTLTTAQQNGQTLFAARCASCHPGAFYTDSGNGNPTLDMTGTILLHDIGTCVTTGDFPDKTATDIAGGARQACLFDTPTLRGVFATAPYFHDGSAATLDDAVLRVPGTSDLTAAQRADLVAYLKTL